MTLKTAATTLLPIAAVETDGSANLDLVLRRRKHMVAIGALAAAATGTFLLYYVDHAIILKRAKLCSAIAVADHATDIQTYTLSTVDGAGGSPSAIGHWATTTGQEGALSAGIANDFHGLTANLAIAAGSYIALVVTAGAGGKASNVAVELDVELVGE